MKQMIEIDVPEGYEAVGYRFPRQGDIYMSNKPVEATYDFVNVPYLILRRKKRKEIVFIEDVNGDYIAWEGKFMYAYAPGVDVNVTRYRREEREV